MAAPAPLRRACIGRAHFARRDRPRLVGRRIVHHHDRLDEAGREAVEDTSDFGLFVMGDGGGHDAQASWRSHERGERPPDAARPGREVLVRRHSASSLPVGGAAAAARERRPRPVSELSGHLHTCPRPARDCR